MAQIVRGGGWAYNVPSEVPATLQDWFSPTFKVTFIGFRCFLLTRTVGTSHGPH